MRRLNGCLGIIAFAALAAPSHATAQPYFLSALATATESPDVLIQTFDEGFVSAANAGGSTDPDAPSTVATLAEGGPASFVATASSAAQSLGPAAAGSGRARVIAGNDELFFTTKVASRVRVSLGFERAISTAWAGDDAIVNLSSTWQVRTAGGTLAQAQQFLYAERDNGTTSVVTVDQRDPLEFDLLPGDSLFMSAQGEVIANAAADSMVDQGAADAELRVTFFVDTVEGDAEFASSISGNTYGPPPCTAADLVEPFGLLDLADTVAFATAFLADDPAVDFDDSGLLDLADIVTFVESFLAGCDG